VKVKKIINTIIIFSLLLTLSCGQSYTKKIEKKDRNIIIYDKDKANERKIEIYKVNEKKISGKTVFMDFDSLSEGNLNVKIKQKIKCPEYKGEAYSVYKETGRRSCPLAIALLPFPMLGCLLALAEDDKNKQKKEKALKECSSSLSNLFNLVFGKKEGTILEKTENRNLKPTGNFEWKTFALDSGIVTAKIYDQTFQAIPDYNGKIFIDLISILRHANFISETLKIELSVKSQGQTEIVNLIFNDHELSKLEPLIADMKDGKTTLAPFTDAEIMLKYNKDFVLNNGENDVFLLKIENIGKGDIFKLKANISSYLPVFDKKELLIGHVPPGLTRYARFSFTIPQNSFSQDVQIHVHFTEGNGYEPNDITKLIHIIGEAPPKFTCKFFIKDDGSGNSIGNGDGIIAIRESIDIIMDIKNIGGSKAENTKAWIELAEDNIEGLVLNIDHINIGDIEPQKTVQDKFTITVQPSYQLNTIFLNLTIEDSVYKTQLRKRIILPLGKPVTEILL